MDRTLAPFINRAASIACKSSFQDLKRWIRTKCKTREVLSSSNEEWDEAEQEKLAAIWKRANAHAVTNAADAHAVTNAADAQGEMVANHQIKERSFSKNAAGSAIVRKALDNVIKLLEIQSRDNEHWNEAARQCGHVSYKMHHTEVTQTFHLFAMAKFRDRALLGRLFRAFRSAFVTFTADEICCILKSCMQLDVRHKDAVLILIDRFTFLMERSDFVNKVVDNNASSFQRLVHSQKRMDSRKPCAESIVTVAVELSKAQIYHPRFWKTLILTIQPTLLSRLSTLDQIELLESLSRHLIRIPEALTHFCETFLFPRLSSKKGSSSFGIHHRLADLETAHLLRIMLAFESLKFVHEEWVSISESQLHLRIQTLLNQDHLTKKIQYVDWTCQLCVYLNFIVCVRKTQNYDLVVDCCQFLSTQVFSSLLQRQFRPLMLYLWDIRPDIAQRIGTIDKTEMFNLKEDSKLIDKNLNQIFYKIGKWGFNVNEILKELKIETESTILNIGGSLFKIRHIILSKSLIIWCVGPFNYYLDTTEMTSKSLVIQRQLESQGYHIMKIPYFSWISLTDRVDKKRYLLQLGREAAQHMSEFDSNIFDEK